MFYNGTKVFRYLCEQGLNFDHLLVSISYITNIYTKKGSVEYLYQKEKGAVKFHTNFIQKLNVNEKICQT